MAEVGRDKATAPMFVFESSHFNSNSNSNSNARFSVGSAHSENSQYLVVHHRDSLNPEIGTPMSVRPFSPSESFAFPKPPEAASARNSVHSRPATASSTHSASGTFSAKDIDDAIPPTPALPQLHLLQSPVSPSSNPFADNNPFDDPAAAAVNNGSVGEFAETETIRRPFHPTLPDELKVRPDDIVHIIQSFDDGWALVEKLDVKGKGKEGAEPERGLIPVDCLREPGLDLPAFCAAKRMSSYTGPVADGGVHAL
ncbi:hypothetical protein NLJ89_g8533 [Agrocybe chaxingu]|uniref:SH3 domain-containing protein n=1 Tax=Agrocybe chaxingu TaxID=84603 RepID=A0A9W8JUG8_9AGAR|nr:hypothetical protein NLJ89_g8533 [Agrocybe chaxingu]